MLKKVVLLMFVFVSVSSLSFAAEKKINFNAENIKKASEILKQNRELIQNKELFEKVINMMKTLKKDK